MEIYKVLTTPITTAEATGLAPGQIYGFSVRAINVVGESQLSTLTTIMAATVPSAPSKPVLISQSQSQITFSWSPNANTGGTPITKYKVYWS